MNPNTRIVLANALYFNAQWQSNFIEGATGVKKFYPNGRDTEPALDSSFMAHGGKFPHNFDPETNSDIIGFPYKQNSTTMYVILPKNSNSFRLRDVQAQLTADKIDLLIDGMSLKTAVVLFPKMHLKSSHYLKTELKNMDLKSLFDENQR
jgi:serine protease inhibitor